MVIEATQGPVDGDGTLASLGWQAFFAEQVTAADLARTPPVRATQAHRNSLRVTGAGVDRVIPWVEGATVGDWLLLNADLPTSSRVLSRKTGITRRAAGHDKSSQLIAANLDTAFIVTSCNADFNVARLERYIALVLEAEVTPVIVLTKADLCDDPGAYVAQARAITDLAQVITMNARDQDDVRAMLAPWCGAGRTVGFLGSSGVGKSTLTNALFAEAQMATGEIREDDARGRHTTTGRQLFFVPGGCAVLDTPGMRELQMTDAAGGVGAVFADLAEVAATCKFRDCAHVSEPGCRIRAGLADGSLDADRVARWRKLVDEDAANTETLADRRKRLKAAAKPQPKASRGKRR
jgi:ribosome biogenesis GTPase